MNFEINLWTIVAGIAALLVGIELATIKVVKHEAQRFAMKVRGEYLNKVNNLPGSESEYVRFINAVWSSMYDDPNSWEYPDQVIRHVDRVKQERDLAVKALRQFVRLLPIELSSGEELRKQLNIMTSVLDKIEPNWRNK